MQKIALFIIAVAITGAFAAITNPANCLINNAVDGSTACLLCETGKQITTDCTTSVLAGCKVYGGKFPTIPGFTGFCEVCDKGLTNKLDGSCVSVTSSQTITACGLKIAESGTAFACLGCDGAATLTNIVPATGCAATVNSGAAAPITLTTGFSACVPNSLSNSAGTTCGAISSAPTAYVIHHVIPATPAQSVPYWISATNAVLANGAIVTDATKGADGKCWFADASNCIRCRPGLVPKYEAVGTAPKTLKVTCSTWANAVAASGAGSGKLPLASWMNGSVEQHLFCGDSTGTFSSPDPANFSCSWNSTNNSNNSNNSNQNTNSSILGFSVAAFLLLIINRLF